MRKLTPSARPLCLIVQALPLLCSDLRRNRGEHMRNKVATWAICTACLVTAAHANAQTIDLASGAADPIWHGDIPGARAGYWLDQGAISQGDSRRDLVIGVPGDATIAGRVYVVFGGPLRTGNLPLSSADTVLTGAAAGDRFGTASATGNVRNVEGTFPKTLVVGAPGAAGNRGVVYVYDTGFHGGDSVSTSAAVCQIIGATGDQLGTVLATADLNNDGYREIVIGAPGNGRIYVISGGPSLSGVIDLSVQTAAVTFTQPGLGHNLAAGDITGDGIADLLVGIEAANVVNVLKGRNGSMPPGAFDMTFGGIQPGDGVGSSVRLADVDADGRSDIIVGAPTADGPGDARPDAGEVYLIWGSPTISGRSLATADVTFYGAEAGARMGALLAAGDINRDIPNDLVFVSSAGRGGAGTIQLYYGRTRSSIGLPTGDGRRYVDFAGEAPNRSILGNTSGGSITSAIVYEVTGEGARDVIVGMSGNDGNVGSVYFTISPRFTLSDNSLSVSALAGAVRNATVMVRNISDIGITWRTSTDRPWLTATAEGSTSAAAPGTIAIRADGSALSPGIYTGTVTVTSTSFDLIMSRTIAVRFKVQATPFDDLLLWQNTANGHVTAWYMSGPPDEQTDSWEFWSTTDLPPDWKVVATGDFNRDGNIDIVWQNESTRQVTVWYLGRDATGAPVRIGWNFLSSSGVPGWHVVGAADFNADGSPDIVWQNDNTRQVTVWYLGGAQGNVFLGWTSLTAGVAGWRVAAVNDFNADRRPDLVWQNDSTRQVTVWYMGGANGDAFLGWSYLTSSGVPGWSVIGARDFSLDRQPDLVWLNDSNGQVIVWYLGGPQGNTMLGWDYLTSTGVSGWRALAR